MTTKDTRARLADKTRVSCWDQEDLQDDLENPYLLLTPGPLSTSPGVRRAMLKDHCTWDEDYKSLVTNIRHRLVRLATDQEDVTSVLMQGSGTFAVESAIGSLLPPKGKLLVVNNGAYGSRIGQIACRLRIPRVEITVAETKPAGAGEVDRILQSDPEITHVALVHCETTTGLLNPAREIGRLAKQHGKVFLLDAMSSFGGIPFRMEDLFVDCLITSANKCLQGVPGFGIVLVKKGLLEQSAGWARSLSLDLYEQWQSLEFDSGKWRYTSPTHVVRAFARALDELDEEGGIPARHQRYRNNQKVLSQGMREIGFQTLLPEEIQSPIITSFLYPQDFSFADFYQALKTKGFVIYPGKISRIPTFRIGSIGHIFPSDIDRLLDAIRSVKVEKGKLF